MWKKKIFSIPKPVLLQRLGVCSSKTSASSLQTTNKQDEKKQDKKGIATLLPSDQAPFKKDSLIPIQGLQGLQKETLVKIEEIIGNKRETGSSSTPNTSLTSLCVKIAAISTILGCKKIISDQDGKSSKIFRLHHVLPGLSRLYRVFFPSPLPGRALAVVPPICSVSDTGQSKAESSESGEELSGSLSTSFDSTMAACASWTQNYLGVKLVTLKQHDKAADLFEKACTSGLSSAQFNLGLCYEKGHGVPKDIEKAVCYYSQAAKQKHPGAIYNLAGFYFQGAGGLPRSKDMGMALLEEAAQLGSRQAQTYLGLYYADESTGESNLAKSHQLFLQAASQKDVDAQYYLGVCYEKGLGVDRDMEEAFQWYSCAAEAGHIAATFNLGVFHQHGLGGLPRDTDKAILYYRTAAEAGDQDAKYNLEQLEKSAKDIKAHDILMSLMAHLKIPDHTHDAPSSEIRIPRHASSPGLLGSLEQGDEWIRGSAREGKIANTTTDVQMAF